MVGGGRGGGGGGRARRRRGEIALQLSDTIGELFRILALGGELRLGRHLVLDELLDMCHALGLHLVELLFELDAQATLLLELFGRVRRRRGGDRDRRLAGHHGGELRRHLHAAAAAGSNRRSGSKEAAKLERNGIDTDRLVGHGGSGLRGRKVARIGRAALLIRMSIALNNTTEQIVLVVANKETDVVGGKELDIAALIDRHLGEPSLSNQCILESLGNGGIERLLQFVVANEKPNVVDDRRVVGARGFRLFQLASRIGKF
jgi:hypothetical protein